MYCCYIVTLVPVLICLVYTTNCAVYYVVPEDHYPATNNDTNTLQYYVNHFKKYLLSNTQLIFLPGKHELQTDLPVKDVYNFTLSGAEHNTSVYCSSDAHIVVIHSSNINIRHLNVTDCGYYAHNAHLMLPLAVMHIFKCSDISIKDSIFMCQYQQCGLVFDNVVGFIYLHNITSSHLLITHNMTKGNSTMEIRNYNHYDVGHPSYKHSAIEISLYEHSQYIKITFLSIKLHSDKAMHIFSSTATGANVIKIVGMNITDINFNGYFIFITISENIGAYHSTHTINTIWFIDCQFSKMVGNDEISDSGVFRVINQVHLGIHASAISIHRCSFNGINSKLIFLTTDDLTLQNNLRKFQFILQIENSSFANLKSGQPGVIYMESTYLILKGPVTFTKIVSDGGILSTIDSEIFFSNHIIFSLSQAQYCILNYIIVMNNNTKLDIIANNYSVIFYTDTEPKLNNLLHYIRCLFQYINTLPQQHNIDQPPSKLQDYQYSVVLQDNNVDLFTNKIFATSHCDWSRDSVFTESDPFEVNQKIIHYVNNTVASNESYNIPRDICYCTDDQHYNCSIDELGPVYPGQSVTFNLVLRRKIHWGSATVTIRDVLNRACKSNGIKNQPWEFDTCTEIPYSIRHMPGNSCELYLLAYIQVDRDTKWDITTLFFVNAFRVTISPCPLGFTLNEILKICQCDPILKISLDSCNIDTQAIPRPANSWITGRTNVNNSHTYQVSSHCPFDYCLHHSSHLNLSNPDSQCQFNRTGVLCGRCKEGFSTVFGTSQCKGCSNYYLFLLIVFTFIGCALILFLFIVNFTVVDGNINGLIFYANIVSINAPVFFPSYEPTITYVLT